NLGLIGLFAARYALREGGVGGVFGFHAVWNWAQGNVFGLAVSGVSSTGGSFITLQENGPAWLTGGAFGPEGGVVVTLLLGLATGALVWLGRRQKKPAEPGA
ncbi:MAG: CPBP family intramembrane glutamate endopeptidase, partial [Anaerolineae bacterium]